MDSFSCFISVQVPLSIHSKKQSLAMANTESVSLHLT